MSSPAVRAYLILIGLLWVGKVDAQYWGGAGFNFQQNAYWGQSAYSGQNTSALQTQSVGCFGFFCHPAFPTSPWAQDVSQSSFSACHCEFQDGRCYSKKKSSRGVQRESSWSISAADYARVYAERQARSSTQNSSPTANASSPVTTTPAIVDPVPTNSTVASVASASVASASVASASSSAAVPAMVPSAQNGSPSTKAVPLAIPTWQNSSVFSAPVVMNQVAVLPDPTKVTAPSKVTDPAVASAPSSASAPAVAAAPVAPVAGPSGRPAPQQKKGSSKSENEILPAEISPDETKSPCEADFYSAVLKSLESDPKQNLLGSLFELSAVKMALHLNQTSKGAKSVEDYLNQNAKSIAQKLANASPAEKEKIKKLYQQFGQGSDLQAIQEGFENQNQKYCLLCKGAKVKNEAASSIILAMTLGEKPSGFTEADAASVWLVEKLRSKAAKTDPNFNEGGEQGNLLSFSVRVSRYLGNGAKAMTAEQMKQAIETQQKKIASALSKAVEQNKSTLVACLSKEMNCADCGERRFREMNKGSLMSTELLSKLIKKEEAQIQKNLRGKVGGVSFDLSNAYSEAQVPWEQTAKDGIYKDVCEGRASMTYVCSHKKVTLAEYQKTCGKK